MKQVMNFARQCKHQLKQAVKNYMYNTCIIQVNDHCRMYIPMWSGTQVFVEHSN